MVGWKGYLNGKWIMIQMELWLLYVHKFDSWPNVPILNDNVPILNDAPNFVKYENMKDTGNRK